MQRSEKGNDTGISVLSDLCKSSSFDDTEFILSNFRTVLPTILLLKTDAINVPNKIL